MKFKGGDIDRNYINEIIRITYKCNWKCKFCNVLKTNNFGESDISHNEIIYNILLLYKKYSLRQRRKLILSFSGGEPTLNRHLISYVKLAREIGIINIQIQTNGQVFFKNFGLLERLVDAGVTEIFLAQHTNDVHINKLMGSPLVIDDFVNFLNYFKTNNFVTKVKLSLNIVVNKINIYSIEKYIEFLLEKGFFDIIYYDRKASLGFVQPNGYAKINKEQVLLEYNDKEIKEIGNIIKLCRKNNILPDFHFTSPPLCILHYPEYNLEYHRLKELKKDMRVGDIRESNLKAYQVIWKEKKKLKECTNCKYDNYCLGFYKNWIEFVGEEYVRGKINSFLKN